MYVEELLIIKDYITPEMIGAYGDGINDEELETFPVVEIKGDHFFNEKGELVEISEIAKAYQAAVDHPVSNGQIYSVLHRHGWRKVMPRSKHPKKASEEEIAASKKLTPK